MPYVNGIWKSQGMYAVIDRRRVSKEDIAKIHSPYTIWNNPLWNNFKNPAAYVLANPHTPAQEAKFRNTLDRLVADPNIVVKEVFCGN